MNITNSSHLESHNSLTKTEQTYFIYNNQEFCIRKFSATAGRRIVANYPFTALPKIGDYEKNEDAMLELMKYVSIKTINGSWQELSTKALIDNHIKGWDTLMHVEWETLKFNCPFLNDGTAKQFSTVILEMITEHIAIALDDAIRKVAGLDKLESTS